MDKREGLTINQLVGVVTEVNTTNGWREKDMTLLTYDHPKAQIAGMTAIAEDVARTVETIRQKERNPSEDYDNICTPGCCVEDAAESILSELKEHGHPLYGSKTEAICAVRLMDTETVELSGAIKDDDIPNMAEELADVVIRALDFVGYWNEAHPDKPLDLQTAIMAKLEKNRERGWHHGGKRA